MHFEEHAGTELLAGPAAVTIRVRAASFEVTAGPDVGRCARLDHPTTSVIGTGASADMRLTDDTISREHLRVTLTPAGVRIVDGGSTNGTWMGDARVHDLTLTNGATLTLGSTTLSLRIEAAAVDVPVSAQASFGGAIGVSPSMRHLFAVLERAAASNVTVLLEGESGVGKELLAQGVHTTSARAEGPFVAVDCGAIPPSLVESELFGYERGAFTGAERARAGVFEQAHGGTLFLDEIGELPLDMQPKLLRALEAREIRPVGGRAAKSVDVRVVAATNRNLADASQKGDFRRDLYYRLAVLRVRVPPLRDRRDDIIPLARAILQRLSGSHDAEIPRDLGTVLVSYAWPGNVRELRNVLERYVVLGPNVGGLFDRSVPTGATSGSFTALAHLPYHEARRVALDQFERDYLGAVLERADNVVTRAAQTAQVGRGSFYRMLQRIRGGAGTDVDEG